MANAIVEDPVSGAPTASQDRLDSLQNANQAERSAAPAILAKPGQLVYIPWRLGRL